MFVTFEGPDGSGKTTALKKLVAILKKQNLNFILTREPGAPLSIVNKKIRRMIVDNKSLITPMTEAILFSAERNLHLDKLIIPALKAKKIVLCDRYFDSTFAYQGAGRKLGIEKMIKLQEIVTNSFYPNYTFYFDISVDEAIKRVNNRGKKNRIDNEDRAFAQRVHDGYKKVIKMYPGRFIVIDASQSEAKVFEQVIKAFNQKIIKDLK